ncbi:hypothetical protein [Antribacter gilvus]|uniref:hypothetical protein n=1 Tax=Antribacter gilvus TaxID=2304675 RepID=UPI000F79110A|nr:hypothetical protein [Antribacter gilvus]
MAQRKALPGDSPVRFAAAAAVIMAIGTVASLLAELFDGRAKQILVIGAAAFVLAGTWAAIRALGMPRMPRWAQVVVVAMSAVGLGVVGFLLVRDALLPDRCPAAVELTVLMPQDGHAELAALVNDFADDYVDDTGCPRAHVTAFETDWHGARAAMTAGWGEDQLRDVGPRPDVWITESAAQVRAVAGGAVIAEASDDVEAGATAPDGATAGEPAAEPGAEASTPPHLTPVVPEFGRQATVGSTPLVLAVPRALPGVERTGVPAADLIEAVAAAGVPVVRAAPDTSFTALRQAEAIYDDVEPDGIRRVEQRVALGLAATGLPVSSDGALMCRLLEASGDSSAPAAVLTTERAMVAYNLGRSCPSGADPGDGLIAYYPDGAGSVTYQATTVRWPGTPPSDEAVDVRTERRRASVALLAWLADDAQATLPERLGLRRADGTVQAPLDASRGVLDNVELDLEAPAWQTLENALTAYGLARRPTHVLVLVDASGSMREQVGASGATRFAIASLRVREAFNYLGPSDGFGLSFFSGSAATSPVTELSISAGRTEGEVAAALAEHAPDGSGPVLDTPLYDAVVDGLAELDARAAADPASLYAMVVLTDGRDESDLPVALADVEARADGSAARAYVVAVGGTSCEETGLGNVAAVTGGQCATSGFDDLDDVLTAFYLQLWGSHAPKE